MPFNFFKKHERQNVVSKLGSKPFASIEVFWFEFLMKKVLSDYKTMSWMNNEKLENFVERIYMVKSNSQTVNLLIETTNENRWYIIKTSVFWEWLSHGLLLLGVEMEEYKSYQLVDKQKNIYDKIQRFSFIYMYLNKLKVENITLFNESSINFDFVIDRYE